MSQVITVNGIEFTVERGGTIGVGRDREWTDAVDTVFYTTESGKEVRVGVVSAGDTAHVERIAAAVSADLRNA